MLEGLITEAAKRGEVDLSLVSIDSTTARAHHDAAGMHLEEAGKRPKVIPRWKNDDASGGGNSG